MSKVISTKDGPIVFGTCPLCGRSDYDMWMGMTAAIAMCVVAFGGFCWILNAIRFLKENWGYLYG